MFEDFRKFIARGNVIDLAVGVVIGAAFSSVVNSFVNDILMPPLGAILNGIDFSELYLNLSGEEYASLAQAQEAGAPTINYGLFLNNIVTFLIVALAVFFLVRAVVRLQDQLSEDEKEQAEEKDARDCPYCVSTISIEATRCPYCTSQLEASGV